ncbi:hypothetical protein [Desulfuromonas acetoxidans]|uniref:hypothetical protein n=1 Tax=Desulfuromonas acetoxidans TaxID=891 RepID=UPI00292D5F59|nr:hypothetical protein [Desulfuromonas acetoxidans]
MAVFLIPAESSAFDSRCKVTAVMSGVADTRLAATVLSQVMFDTRLKSPASALVVGAVTATVQYRPLRSIPTELSINQLSGWLADAAEVQTLCVYSRGVSKSLSEITFPRVSTAELESLRSFVRDSIKGCRHEFTFRTFGQADRVLRLQSPELSADPVGPGRYRVTLEVEELL